MAREPADATAFAHGASWSWCVAAGYERADEAVRPHRCCGGAGPRSSPQHCDPLGGRTWSAPSRSSDSPPHPVGRSPGTPWGAACARSSSAAATWSAQRTPQARVWPRTHIHDCDDRKNSSVGASLGRSTCCVFEDPGCWIDEAADWQGQAIRSVGAFPGDHFVRAFPSRLRSASPGAHGVRARFSIKPPRTRNSIGRARDIWRSPPSARSKKALESGAGRVFASPRPAGLMLFASTRKRTGPGVDRCRYERALRTCAG